MLIVVFPRDSLHRWATAVIPRSVPHCQVEARTGNLAIAAVPKDTLRYQIAAAIQGTFLRFQTSAATLGGILCILAAAAILWSLL